MTHPNSPASHIPSDFLLGSELASLGRFDEAEAAFANAVLVAPGFHLARYQLGLLQFSSGRASAALVTWQPLLLLADAQPLVHFVQGFTALAHDDLATARTHFNTGLARESDNPAVASDIRQVLARMDEIPVAPTTSTHDGDAANHVLLANYGKPGTLH
ncbi:MAG: hypothetical protein H7255_11035 [Ramlibacter sp.]|nr:hypothetical protein [Ramlibacter sp.]